MSRATAQSPIARIAIATLVVVALLATAVGVTIWRYDDALVEVRRGAGVDLGGARDAARPPRRSGTSARR